uniref:Uncharacterized protein n=1 Tax=Cacopsylla melanoneura TaxID=428564 RepID=A0A8D9E6D8_9HEMI
MLLYFLSVTLLLPLLSANPINGTHKKENTERKVLSPEKIERIAQKLLRLTLNTTHVHVSHCIMHPELAFDKDRRIHFHVNVISNVFIDVPIFVRKNITNNLLNSLMENAETHDLSIDCWSTDERPNGFEVDDLEHLKPYAYGEQVLQNILEEEFNKTFIPEFFYVENVCEHYGIQRSQESHFQILIVSDKFEKKTVAERRLMVDEIVRRTMMHGICRLFLKLFSPAEFKIEVEMEKRNEIEGKDS